MRASPLEKTSGGETTLPRQEGGSVGVLLEFEQEFKQKVHEVVCSMELPKLAHRREHKLEARGGGIENGVRGRQLPMPSHMAQDTRASRFATTSEINPLQRRQARRPAQHYWSLQWRQLCNEETILPHRRGPPFSFLFGVVHKGCAVHFRFWCIEDA